MYTIKEYSADINVNDYLDKYVDITQFLEYCKQCPNYDQVWSCPSYDFDVESYWKQYDHLYLYGRQILFDEETRSRNRTQEEMKQFIEKILSTEKQILADKLYSMEKEHPGSISLSAGSCQLCGKNNCSKKNQKPCRYPDKMRHSIESLGGNVGKTISDLFHIELEWMEEGKLPSHFVLVSGLLTK